MSVMVSGVLRSDFPLHELSSTKAASGMASSSSSMQDIGLRKETTVDPVEVDFSSGKANEKSSKRDSMVTWATAEESESLSMSIGTLCQQPETELDDSSPSASTSTSRSTTFSSADSSSLSSAVSSLPTESSRSQSPPSLPKGVKFGTVQIREYSRALGDHPSTSYGPPLTLDWDYDEAVLMNVDDYEDKRPPRRINKQMVVPGKTRESILLEQTAATKDEIKKSVNQVRAVRNQRRLTETFMELEDYHLVFEFLARRFRRMRRGVTKEKEQEMLWKQAKVMAEEGMAREKQQNESKQLDSSSSTKASDSSSDSADGEAVCTAE